MRSRAAGAERVSFHSSASRTTRPSASRATMPCCWPPTARAATSSSPPASAIATSRASHQAAGSTEVPSGWEARPVRTTRPVSASRITTLQLWVEESTPATSVIACPFVRELPTAASPAGFEPSQAAARKPGVGRSGQVRGVGSAAGAEQVLGDQLLQADEAEALAVEVGRRVEVLVRRAVAEQVGVALALVQGRLSELGRPGGLERLLDLGVGAEGRGTLLEQQVVAHVRGGRLPDAGLVLGAARLVVEVAGAVVGGTALDAAVLQQVDEREGVVELAVTEHEVLVVLDPTLAVEVDVEELALVQRLRDAGGEGQA